VAFGGSAGSEMPKPREYPPPVQCGKLRRYTAPEESVHRVPSINLRLDPSLLAQVREAAGPGELTAAINQAMQMWLAAKRAPQPEPAAAAPTPVPVPAVAAPFVLEPPRSSLPATLPLPPNAYRPPGQ
jgi:hypothetical protein